MSQPQQIETGSDGLPVIVQGPWSRDKLYFVEYFAALFNGGMKNKWPVRIYVDLLAGPGLCRDRANGPEFDGSPLQALKCQTPFTKLFFNDINPAFVDALRTRQKLVMPQADVEYSVLDCNQAASRIRGAIPRSALVLAFIDPWKYEIKFDALASLASLQNIDLIVTFHHVAIKRNAHRQLAAVDEFLDDKKWRDRYLSSEGDPSNPRTAVLIETFQARLKEKLGYQYFGHPEVIKNSNGAPIFYLLFASRNARGLNFWEKSGAKSRSGQRTLL